MEFRTNLRQPLLFPAAAFSDSLRPIRYNPPSFSLPDTRQMADSPPSCYLSLAPMQGLTDAPMRDLLTRIGGFDECVSEFVRITHTVPAAKNPAKMV